MGVPQIILICFYGLSLGVALAQHGKPKEGKNNFAYSVVALAIIIGLLTWGGFWN